MKIVVLSCLIALVAGGKQAAFKIPTFANVAESGHTRLVEGVLVPDLPVNVESAQTGAYEFINISGRFVGRLIHVHDFSGREIEYTLVGSGGRSGEIWLPDRISLRHPWDAIVGGSLSGIRKFNLERHHPVPSAASRRGGKNVGPQLFLGRCFGRCNLPNKTNELQDGDNSQHAGEDHQPPIGRRLLITVIGYLGGFILALLGCDLRASGHSRVGWCLIGLAVLSATAGIALWIALGFPASWRWPI